MAKKSLGYVRLQWVCPSCGTKNLGTQRMCASCGQPQPEDVKFQQMAEEDLITDEAEIAQAEAGPDIHCRYCGTRNPAGAETCTQCGAPLEEGEARTEGQVLGAFRSEAAPPISCPACGTENDPDASLCVQCGASLVEPEESPSPAQSMAPTAEKKGFQWPGGIWGGIVAAVVVILLCATCGTYFFLANRTEDVSGTVQQPSWRRVIEIEELVPVEREAWRDQIPSGVAVGSCVKRKRRTQNNPAPGAKEVCGTPYTVNKGSGYGRVVQDCKYEVYDDMCTYMDEEWREVNEEVLTGNDFNPRWPNPRLRQKQREGDREEFYRIIFNTTEGQYTYSTTASQFNRFQMGSRWILKINTFGQVRDVEPLP